MPGSDVAAHLDPVAVGEPHVQHGDMRAGGRDPTDGLLRGAGLADHGQVVFRFEQVAHSAANDLVIVEEEDPGRFGHGAHSSA